MAVRVGQISLQAERIEAETVSPAAGLRRRRDVREPAAVVEPVRHPHHFIPLAEKQPHLRQEPLGVAQFDRVVVGLHLSEVRVQGKRRAD